MTPKNTDEYFLVVKLYYSIPDIYNPIDTNGDHILLNFVKPVFQKCSVENWSDRYYFTRFSVKGYHLHLAFYGEKTSLTQKLKPFIEEQFTLYIEKNPMPFTSEMKLLSMSQTLNKKWGDNELLPPGTLDIRYVFSPQDILVHGTEENRQRYHHFHTFLTTRILNVLAIEPNLQPRMIFARMLVDDFLRATCLSPKKIYLFLRFLATMWVDYFEIEPDAVQAIQTVYHAKKKRFHIFFDQKISHQDSLKMLPKHLHALYTETATYIEKAAKYINETDKEEGLMFAPQSLFHLLAFFHLLHNRMGINLMYEIQMAYILSQYYQENLIETKTNNAEQEQEFTAILKAYEQVSEQIELLL